jgi:uncharacterized HAD superfamily protein
MKIAIDIDDTIVDTSSFLFKLLKKNHFDIKNKKDIIKGDIKSANIAELIKNNIALIIKHNKLKANVIKSINYLKSKNYELHILSSRFIESYDLTKEFLDKNKVYYDFLTLGYHNKKDYCLSNKIDYLIDDAESTVLSLLNTKTKPILFSSKINKDFKNDKIIRIKNWNEIKEIL